MKGLLYKWLLISCSLFLFISAVAQENLNENGYNKIYYPNGKLSSEGFMKNGKPEGLWKTYYPSGVIRSEGIRKNHLLDSIWVFFNEAGDTLQKVSYSMSKKNGYTLNYYQENDADPMVRGRIVSKELYVNDKKEGLSWYYYLNGALKEEVTFLNNKRNGITREFDEDGTLITLLNYRNGLLIERERINRRDMQGRKQGTWKTYFENGRLQNEMSFEDDLLTGVYKEYEDNGNLKLFIKYSKGLIVEEKDTVGLDIEIRNEYDENGNLIYSGSYRENIPVGIHRHYDSSGKVSGSEIYSDEGRKLGEGIITNEGKKEGIWKYFHNNGKVKSSGSYSNNLEQGKWLYYFENGLKEQEGVFKNGKPNGLWQWFYQNGGIKREEEYFDGKEEGLYAEYDTVGQLLVKGSYFDGQKEGEWIYQIGDYTEKGKYVGDMKDGKWQAFYSDGKLKYEGNFIQGNPDGEHIFYYNNGQIKEIHYYTMGISEKNWKKFDENGMLLLTITYKNNREYRINGEKVEFADRDIKLIQ